MVFAAGLTILVRLGIAAHLRSLLRFTAFVRRSTENVWITDPRVSSAAALVREL